MFAYNRYIEYRLMLKDEEINENFLKMNDIFKQYLNNEVSKSYLLDKHTERNKMIYEWFIIHNYILYLSNKYYS